ncbi:MAG: hypothetical protein GX051_07100 [Clostridiales bacterium]|nr:hypothetical protein [Clostridiales bacterium]
MKLKRITALVLCAVFCFVMAFSVAFTAAESGHTCIQHENCLICATLRVCSCVMENFVFAAASLAAAIIIFLVGERFRNDGKYEKPCETPVLLKVKLSF